LSNADRDRLGEHVAHFNARDFDAIRAMTADDVRLDHAPYVIDGAEYLTSDPPAAPDGMSAGYGRPGIPTRAG
jgi:hypothetical protein